MARRRFDLKGYKVLITAGPTREYIDPVRFLSNPSSGRMGYALAEAARSRGAEVTLVSGPTELKTPARIKRIDVVSAADMYRTTIKNLRGKDVVIMTAAVADYRPARIGRQKMKKQGRKSLELKLVPTQDILKTLGRKKKATQFLVGFAAETRALMANARKKLVQKKLDMIVANPVGDGQGFAVNNNRATLLCADGTTKKLPMMNKRRLADRILDQVTACLAS